MRTALGSCDFSVAPGQWVALDAMAVATTCRGSPTRLSTCWVREASAEPGRSLVNAARLCSAGSSVQMERMMPNHLVFSNQTRRISIP